MKSTLRITGIVAGLTVLAISGAHAQAVIGGGGGMGLLGPIIDYFRANMLAGILYIAVAGVFILMMCMRFHLLTALAVAGGIVGVIRTQDIVSALMSFAG